MDNDMRCNLDLIIFLVNAESEQSGKDYFTIALAVDENGTQRLY